MRKSFFIYFTFLIFLRTTIHAQVNTGYSVKGFVKDEENQALEFVLVSLHQVTDSSLVKTIVTENQGSYSFNFIAPGTYYLEGFLNGYGLAFSPAFSLDKSSPEILIDLKMPAQAFTTEDVVVQGQKSLVQQEAGTTIVNVENTTANAGLSVAEALKRVPGVSVDNNGQIKIKGKAGVMVMIDDKPMYMDAAQVGALLKSLPADQVKQIEVMTSPSAKFDAAGTAGVVNIKLKKGAYEGFDGTINNSFGYGLYPKASTGVNVSYRKNKLSLNGSYQYNYKKNLQRFYIFRNYITDISSDSSYNTSSDFSQPEHIHSFLFGGNYAFGKNGSLNWDGNGIFNKSFWNGGSNSSISAASGEVLSVFRTTDHSHDLTGNYGGSLGYKHKLDTTGSEISALVDIKTMQKKSFQNFTTVYLNASTPPFSYSSDIPINLEQISAKLDLTKILLKDLKIESGVKFNSIATESRINNSLGQANHFLYTEKIYAAYAQVSKTFGKWKIQTGLRLEHTGTKGDQRSIDSVFTRKYTNLFPSATISYNKSEKTSYTFLYTKRVDRPNYEALNPFFYYNDPYSIFSGYPYLLPQYTQHMELTFSSFNGYFLSTLDYSYTSRPQSDVFIIDKNSLTTTYTKRNLKNLQNTGISFSLNMPVTKWWTATNFLHIFNNRQVGNVGYGEITLSKNSWSFNTSHSFKLPQKFSAEISGMYESPSFYGTVFYRDLWQISLGISKKILKDRFTVKLAATDLFWKYYYQGEGTFGTIKTKDGYKWDNRVVMFTLSYHLRKSLIPDTSDNKILENSGGGKSR